ncbi:hypothetical protein RHGRI_016347 [Rhododendron griersonianum]|uniref:Signal recognition particle SRP54 helical bundle domain-containing protein n=1 Tax=Rhododendron griersonianum TaxID=479676 RepID=A0AAV6JTW7_9ERIC|nr:hypothetical protein RHGRI_016347 [Rhododendron griersonianum]
MKGDAKNEEKKEKCVSRIRGSISRALQQMSNATIIDEKVVDECLNEIARALLQANVRFKLVRDLQTNIKKMVNLDHLAAGLNKRKIIEQVRYIRRVRFIRVVFVCLMQNCHPFDYGLLRSKTLIRTPPISVRHSSRIVFYFDGNDDMLN